MHRTTVPVILCHWSDLLHILRVILDECISSVKEIQDENEAFREYHSITLNGLTFPHICVIFTYILCHFLHVRGDGGKTSFNSQTCFISNKLRGWETNQTTDQLASQLTNSMQKSHLMEPEHCYHIHKCPQLSLAQARSIPSVFPTLLPENKFQQYLVFHVIFPLDFPNKTWHAPIFSPTYAICPAHLIILI